MKKKIRMFLLRLVAKRIIDKTGKVKWEKAKGKIGVLIALLVYVVKTVLPAFDVHIEIPPAFFEFLIALGLSVAGLGIRDALERTEDKLNNLPPEIDQDHL